MIMLLSNARVVRWPHGDTRANNYEEERLACDRMRSRRLEVLESSRKYPIPYKHITEVNVFRICRRNNNVD